MTIFNRADIVLGTMRGLSRNQLSANEPEGIFCVIATGLNFICSQLRHDSIFCVGPWALMRISSIV